jgi:K+-transporting ATPase ATPase C chain
MWKNISRAMILFISFTFLTGVLYPLTVTGLAQLFFPNQANGSLIYRNGKLAGSSLIGQHFDSPRYFHGRPSAADYNGMASGGSNMAPTNRELLRLAKERAVKIRQENQLPTAQSVPSDLVTASASGLDPHISLEGALLQVPRVARTRNLQAAKVRQLVHKNIEKPVFGVLGTPRVNVLRLNMALDSLANGADET